MQTTRNESQIIPQLCNYKLCANSSPPEFELHYKGNVVLIHWQCLLVSGQPVLTNTPNDDKASAWFDQMININNDALIGGGQENNTLTKVPTELVDHSEPIQESSQWNISNVIVGLDYDLALDAPDSEDLKSANNDQDAKQIQSREQEILKDCNVLEDTLWMFEEPAQKLEDEKKSPVISELKPTQDPLLEFLELEETNEISESINDSDTKAPIIQFEDAEVSDVAQDYSRDWNVDFDPTILESIPAAISNHNLGIDESPRPSFDYSADHVSKLVSFPVVSQKKSNDSIKLKDFFPWNIMK